MLRIIVCIILYLYQVFADVSLYSPAPNELYKIKSSKHSTLSVAWVESGATPHLDRVQNYTIVLCNGTNDKINSLKTVEKQIPATRLKKVDNVFNITLASDLIFQSGVYFFQVIALGEKFVTIHYTNRFKVTLENDDNEEKYEKLLQLPSPFGEVIFFDQNQKYTSSTKSINTQYYTIPYQQQTKLGSVRYAPMQQTPGKSTKGGRWSKATPLTTKPRSSSLQPFTKVGAILSGKAHSPNVGYTITQPPTKLKVTSANTFDHARWPTMWYNPKSKVIIPSLRSTSESIPESTTKG